MKDVIKRIRFKILSSPLDFPIHISQTLFNQSNANDLSSTKRVTHEIVKFKLK